MPGDLLIITFGLGLVEEGMNQICNFYDQNQRNSISQGYVSLHCLVQSECGGYQSELGLDDIQVRVEKCLKTSTNKHSKLEKLKNKVR